MKKLLIILLSIVLMGVVIFLVYQSYQSTDHKQTNQFAGYPFLQTRFTQHDLCNLNLLANTQGGILKAEWIRSLL